MKKNPLRKNQNEKECPITDNYIKQALEAQFNTKLTEVNAGDEI